MYYPESPVRAASHKFPLATINKLQAAAAKFPNTGLTPIQLRAYTYLYGWLAWKATLDPVFLLCQSWHETARWSSWWWQAPRRNPAGIRVTGAHSQMDPRAFDWYYDDDRDMWLQGRSFPHRRQAAECHVRLVGQYVGVPEHFLPPVPFEAPAFIRGTCSQFRHFGARHNITGKGWAFPGDEYGKAIARLANQTLHAG